MTGNVTRERNHSNQGLIMGREEKNKRSVKHKIICHENMPRGEANTNSDYPGKRRDPPHGHTTNI